ncbi:MAG: hypothetical protein HOL58_03470 [Francisellaceae bacterium]|nr:hypothetical protein [Francisellaceae bacterium]
MPAKLSDYIKDREFENGNVLDLGNPRVIALIEAFKADPSIDVLTKEELYSFAFKEGLAVSEEDCNYISGNLYKSDGRVYVQTGHKLGSGAYGEVMLIQEVESGELYALKSKKRCYPQLSRRHILLILLHQDLFKKQLSCLIAMQYYLL